MPPAEQICAENKQLHAVNRQLGDENIELRLELARLRAQIEYYKRKLYDDGQGEKMDRAQMLLALDELGSAAQKAAELETITYSREKTPRKPSASATAKPLKNCPSPRRSSSSPTR